MIKTGQGTLAVTHTTGTNSQKLLSSSTCRFAFVNHSQYTVEGGKSTGTFKNASGSGTAVITFTGNLPKKSDGALQHQQQRGAPAGHRPGQLRGPRPADREEVAAGEEVGAAQATATAARARHHACPDSGSRWIGS